MDSCWALAMKEQVLTTMTSASSGFGSELGAGCGEHAHHHLAIDEVLGAAEADKAYFGREQRIGESRMIFFFIGTVRILDQQETRSI